MMQLGFLGSAIQNIVPKLLVKLRDYYPDIKTSLDELANKAQLDAVLKDKLDVGFVRLARVPSAIKMTPII